MTNREINALIAEKVMGLPDTTWCSHKMVYGATTDGVKHKQGTCSICGAAFEDYGRIKNYEDLPHYSTDISAAWEVVAKNFSDIELESFDNLSSWECWVCGKEGYTKAYADTAPMAICLAALKAVGVEIGDYF